MRLQDLQKSEIRLDSLNRRRSLTLKEARKRFKLEVVDDCFRNAERQWAVRERHVCINKVSTGGETVLKRDGKKIFITISVGTRPGRRTVHYHDVILTTM
jgi:hypothetical protein